jgi:DNA-directed RNA polymerase specialized sigma24 family protein
MRWPWGTWRTLSREGPPATLPRPTRGTAASVVARLSAAEVATALGKTIGEVKALRHRGLAALTGVLDLPGSF